MNRSVLKVFPLHKPFPDNSVTGFRRNPPRTKLRSAGKDRESEQMAACHLTHQQNHSPQLHPEMFPHFLLSPSSCLLSPISCVHLGYKTHSARSGDQLGKQTNKKIRPVPSSTTPKTRGSCIKQYSSGSNTEKTNRFLLL